MLTNKNTSNNLLWYPPAETKIPLSLILKSFLRIKDNDNISLQTLFHTPHFVLAENARSLLFKLLEILKDRDAGNRDEVLIPGYTCYSVAAAVAKSKLKIAVYDLDPETLFPDPDSFKNAISEKTLAVIGQHLFGRIFPIDNIVDISKKYGAYFIEDSAQSLVSSSKPYSNSCDFSLFSFGRGKPLPIGTGGALTTDKYPEIINSIHLSPSGVGFKKVFFSAVSQIISKPFFYWLPEMLPLGLGKTTFDPAFYVQGLAPLGLSLLRNSSPTLDSLNSHRLRISNIYEKNIIKKNQFSNASIKSSIIRFPVKLSNFVIGRDSKRFGIRAGYPQALINNDLIKPFIKKAPEPTPGAIEISEKLFTLPTHTGITKATAVNISTYLNDKCATN
jgi:dTDP-4-amino-4,6-dideoxygalactose transaminase